MKAIILISSIFYILGLKISNKIDVVKKSSPIKKAIAHTVTPEPSDKNADFNKEKEIMNKEDSLQDGGSANQVLQYK